MWQALVKLLLTLPAWLLFRPRVVGWRRLFRSGPAIIAANHFSCADPAFILFVCPRRVRYMAKSELFERPLPSLLLTALGAFPVQHAHMEISSVRRAQRVLDGGGVLGIFPEGRRSLTAQIDTLDKGAAFLALRCHAPIVPIYADPQAHRRLRIGMIVGEPIHADEIAATCAGKPVDTVTLALYDSLQNLKNEWEKRR